jgi:hypothetical protein
MFPPLPRLHTPPPASHSRAELRTPPPKRGGGDGAGLDALGLSPLRTPVSHAGVHMSPSPSLAHFKTHLDPPRTVGLGHGADGGGGTSSSSSAAGARGDGARTPPRKPPSSGALVTPGAFATPRRLFPSAPDLLGLDTLFGASPFRTPGARAGAVGGPQDAGSLLDDEFARLGAAAIENMGESPAGLFGSAGKGLLYESPTAPAASRLSRYW